MAHTNHNHDGEHHPLVGHLVPTSTLVGTGVILLILTVITVAVRYIDIGQFNLAVALGIAVIKATLVVMFFMHLRWDRPFNILIFVGSVLFVILLISFTIMDVVEYDPDVFVGNPKAVQLELDRVAPYAPITSDKIYAP